MDAHGFGEFVDAEKAKPVPSYVAEMGPDRNPLMERREANGKPNIFAEMNGNGGTRITHA